jgi:hypothetical protein
LPRTRIFILNNMADKAKALARVKQESEEMEDCDSEHIM